MIIVILSLFDQIFGPRVLYHYPKVPDYLKLDHIPLLMDIYRAGFCIHKFGDLKTANHIFTCHYTASPRHSQKEILFSRECLIKLQRIEI